MTAHTPVYGLEYIVAGEPLRDARVALENNAHTIEAALVAGGIAPAGASDIATLSGRVSAVERPWFGDYSATQSGVVSATVTNVGLLTKRNQYGFDATVNSSGGLYLPAGWWHVQWQTNITGGPTVSGRNFHEIGGDKPSWAPTAPLARKPFATIGEDTGGSDFLIPLTTFGVLALTYFVTTSSTPVTVNHDIRVLRLGNLL